MRDQVVADLDHFQQQLERAEGYPAEARKHNTVDDIGSLPGVRRNELGRAITEYSMGADIAVIAETYKKLPDWFSRELRITPTEVDDPATTGSPFNDYLWVVSLAVLFDDVDGARLLAEVVERTGMEDFLVDSFLGSLIDWREPSQSLQLETISKFRGVKNAIRSHEPLKAAAELAVNDPAAASAAFTKYVKSDWYRLHSWAGWHNGHLRKGRSYKGYWSFESAAAAKVFGFDDSALENSKYYPWDLAHQK